MLNQCYNNVGVIFMTNNNLYLFGRLYRAFTDEYEHMQTMANYQNMASRPLETFAKLHHDAMKIGMSEKFKNKIGEIVSKIDMDEQIEGFVTIEMQGVFGLAYYQNCTLLQKHIHNMKITQDELAKQIGVDRTTVSGWLNGSSVPGKSNAHKLAEFFNVDENILLV